MSPCESDQKPGSGESSPSQDQDIDWNAVRQNYPGVEGRLYFTSTTRGLLSKAAMAKAQEVLNEALYGTGTKKHRNQILQEMRGRFARLINAESSDQIAVMKNVSEGLNAAVSALDWRAGDNVVITLDLEHPNNVYLWLRLAERGVEIRKVPPRAGAIDSAAMAAAIDRRTRVVTVSSVTFSPGHRTDLASLGRAARRAGAMFLVDAVQSTGVLEVDVAADQIDVMCTSASKGLLGLKGLGLMYVHPAWIERLEPVYVARFSVQRGSGHESEIEELKAAFLPNAQRFEVGHYNEVGVAAALASLDELLALGIGRIDHRVTGLAQTLADGFEALGYPVTKPPAGIKRSHIVTLGELSGGGASAASDPRLNRLAQELKRQGVLFTIRRGLLRFGLNFYNNRSDISALLDLAAGLNDQPAA